MSKAGFWAIHTGELKFGRDGRWYADGEPVLHDRLVLVRVRRFQLLQFLLDAFAPSLKVFLEGFRVLLLELLEMLLPFLAQPLGPLPGRIPALPPVQSLGRTLNMSSLEERRCPSYSSRRSLQT